MSRIDRLLNPLIQELFEVKGVKVAAVAVMITEEDGSAVFRMAGEREHLRALMAKLALGSMPGHMMYRA